MLRKGYQSLLACKVVQQLALDYKLDNWLYPVCSWKNGCLRLCQEQLGLQRKLKSLTRDEEAQVKQALHDTLASCPQPKEAKDRQWGWINSRLIP